MTDPHGGSSDPSLWATDLAAIDRDTKRMSCDLCIIGSGATAQAVARRASKSGEAILVLEAGGTGPTIRRLQHATGPDIPLTGTHAQDPSGQTSIRLGGSLDLPAVRLRPDAAGTGIRLARLTASDLAPRPGLGIPGWPLDYADLEAYYLQAEAEFEFRRPDTASSPLDDLTAPSAPFWCVDRSLIGNPGPARFGSAQVITNAPVWKFVIRPDGRIDHAVIRALTGHTIEVHAERFILAAGLYQSTRILLESSWSGGRHAANSSDLLGRGLMDHPQLRIGTLEIKPDVDHDSLRCLAASSVSDTGVLWPKLVTSSSPEVMALAATVLPIKAATTQPEPRRILGGLRGAQELADQLRSVRFNRNTAAHVMRTVTGAPDLVRLLRTRSRRSNTDWSFENGWWAESNTAESGGRFDILALAEQRPRDENRIQLSKQKTKLGWHHPRITWNWNADDRRLADIAAQPVLDALESAFGPIHRTPANRHVVKFSSHHAAGTARMSLDSESGVVDPNCRTHDHENLYVVGSAVFPTNGYANPTLTDVALGLRLGDHLASCSTIPSTITEAS